MRRKLFLIFFAPLLFFSCTPYDSIPVNIEGYVPVYSPDASILKTIRAEPARATTNGGKIYTVGNLLFQVKMGSGLHIINFANPSSPHIHEKDIPAGGSFVTLPTYRNNIGFIRKDEPNIMLPAGLKISYRIR